MDTEEGKIYTEYRRCSNQLRRLTRKAIKIFEQNIAKDVRNNPKRFWKYAASKTKVKSKIPDLYTSDDESPNDMTENDQEKAEKLGSFFSSVFTNEVEGIWDIANKPEISFKLNLSIDEDTVGKKLAKIKVTKSPGPDLMHPRILYETRSALIKPLTLMYQTSVRTGKLPAAWKNANITAIHKKGNKHVASNNRPVSLISIVCKILESIVRDALIKYMKENRLFSDRQFGFLGGRSTTLQLLKVLDKWTEVLDRGGYVDVVYCDVMKAFDTVPHGRLIQVLHHYGVDDYLVTWIKGFLTNRRQRVVVNGQNSSWYEVKSGIPQGCVLGPVLFVVYINTMVDVVDNSEVVLFADDAKVFHEIPCNSDSKKLQADLNRMCAWSEDSLLCFHPAKCVWMRIGRNVPDYDQEYEMNGFPLSRSEAEVDLGVNIEQDLSFNKHISAKINKANSIAGLIRRSFEYMDKDSFKLVFTALVRPHLEYAQATWSPHLKKHIKAIENVQRRATKAVPGFKDLSYEARLRSMRLPTLAYRRYRGDMIDVFKVTHSIYDPEASKGLLDREKKSVNNRGHEYKINKKGCRLDIRLHSFTYRVVDQWNNLPDWVVTAKSVACFKRRLDKLWHDSDVMFAPDVEVRKLTKERSTRYKTCAHTIDSPLDHDLASEA